MNERTASQTIGPFFAIALAWQEGPLVVPEGTPGRVRLLGRLLDGREEPVPDGLIETWQTDPPLDERLAADDGAFGRFQGFGRCPTDREGWYEIFTVKPGKIRDEDGAIHAPHVMVSIFARGLLKRAVTRIYFPDEPAANEADPVLSRIADAAARSSLVATQVEGGYRFDIRLQGDGETVFFDL